MQEIAGHLSTSPLMTGECLFAESGQIDMENCPFSRIGFYAYMTIMIHSYCVRDRKSHAAAVRFGGKIGIKYFLNMRVLDAGAAVGNRDLDIPAFG